MRMRIKIGIGVIVFMIPFIWWLIWFGLEWLDNKYGTSPVQIFMLGVIAFLLVTIGVVLFIEGLKEEKSKSNEHTPRS